MASTSERADGWNPSRRSYFISLWCTEGERPYCAAAKGEGSWNFDPRASKWLSLKQLTLPDLCVLPGGITGGNANVFQSLKSYCSDSCSSNENCLCLLKFSVRMAAVRYWKGCGHTCAPSSPTAPFQPPGKQRFQAVVSQGASPDLLPSLSWLLGVSVTLRALSSRSAGLFHARTNLFPWHSSSMGLCCAQGCAMSQACQLLRLATAAEERTLGGLRLHPAFFLPLCLIATS